EKPLTQLPEVWLPFEQHRLSRMVSGRGFEPAIGTERPHRVLHHFSALGVIRGMNKGVLYLPLLPSHRHPCNPPGWQLLSEQLQGGLVAFFGVMNQWKTSPLWGAKQNVHVGCLCRIAHCHVDITVHEVDEELNSFETQQASQELVGQPKGERVEEDKRWRQFPPSFLEVIDGG